MVVLLPIYSNILCLCTLHVFTEKSLYGKCVCDRNDVHQIHAKSQREHFQKYSIHFRQHEQWIPHLERVILLCSNTIPYVNYLDASERFQQIMNVAPFTNWY